MRLFAISDIHVDYEENARWVANLSRWDYRRDAVIIAGDISDDLRLLGQTFEHFRQAFAQVFYIPGNHELWVRRDDNLHSVEKFSRVIKLAHSFGCITQAHAWGDLYVVPVHGWYDFSFAEPTEFIRNAWMDFRLCEWPALLDSPQKICEFFLAKNQAQVPEGKRVLTYSHFLPRIDVMPWQIPPHKREIYPVLGSEKIDRVVRALGSELHIYGHSHVNRDVTIDGVRYINNAFAYPSEEMIARKCLLEVWGTERS